ncbi:uncharacterized protein [Phyllobates terribilis]|uniref:uncharacterized protein n=1 Tax=Phyllobates terribilis TaxID=111132 RepID=UPI003CCA78CE
MALDCWAAGGAAGAAPPPLCILRYTGSFPVIVNKRLIHESENNRKAAKISQQRHSGGDRLRHSGGERLRHSGGDRLRHSGGERLRHSGGERLRHSGGERLRHSGGERLRHSGGERLRHSGGDRLRHSGGERLRHSGGDRLRHSGGERLRHSGGERLRHSGGERLRHSGGERLRHSGGDRLRHSGGERLRHSGGERLRHSGGERLRHSGVRSREQHSPQGLDMSRFLVFVVVSLALGHDGCSAGDDIARLSDVDFADSHFPVKRTSYQLIRSTDAVSFSDHPNVCYFIHDGGADGQISCRLRLTRSKFNFNPFGLRFGKRQQNDVRKRTEASGHILPHLLQLRDGLLPPCRPEPRPLN